MATIVVPALSRGVVLAVGLVVRVFGRISREVSRTDSSYGVVMLSWLVIVRGLGRKVIRQVGQQVSRLCCVVRRRIKRVYFRLNPSEWVAGKVESKRNTDAGSTRK